MFASLKGTFLERRASALLNKIMMSKAVRVPFLNFLWKGTRVSHNFQHNTGLFIRSDTLVGLTNFNIPQCLLCQFCTGPTQIWQTM